MIVVNTDTVSELMRNCPDYRGLVTMSPSHQNVARLSSDSEIGPYHRPPIIQRFTPRARTNPAGLPTGWTSFLRHPDVGALYYLLQPIPRLS